MWVIKEHNRSVRTSEVCWHGGKCRCCKHGAHALWGTLTEQVQQEGQGQVKGSDQIPPAT